MIIVGHFSIDETGWDGEVRHGYLTCLMEADSAEDATAAFERVIRSARSENEAFAGWQAVYIEDIIELASLNDQPVITRYQSSSGEFPKSISLTLPLSDGPEIQAYGFKSDVDQLARDDDSSYSEMTPFITF